MSIIQFLRILWAYRYLTLVTTAATLLGGLIAILVVPPSYEAKTRVMLNILKPDPVTGSVLNTASSRTYIATQKELIRDFGVAGQAVDQLGWLNDPNVVDAYGASTGQDSNVRRALAQRIIDRTNVDVVGGTNILEIAFRAATPDQARAMANALREAYIQSTLGTRRQEAARGAEWHAAQAEVEKGLLDKADAAKTAYERENGIVMQDEKTDVDTARLRALSGQSAVAGAIAPPPIVPQTSAAAIQLAQLDSQIAQASRTLGPNHPTMIQLKSQRASLAKVVQDDQAAARAAAAAASAAVRESAGAMARAVTEQTTKVIANRDKIERLTQLQGEVNLHRAQMEKAQERAAELRQEAAVADSGVSVLSEAIAPRSPAFPNKPLIIGGAIGLGAATGLLLSLIIELVRRRVRGVEDLEHAVEAPLLGVISTRRTADKTPWANVVKWGRSPRRAPRAEAA